MAFKLSKAEIKQRDEHVAKLRELAEALSEAVSTYNSAVEEAFNTLSEVRDAYNEALNEAKGFADDVAGNREDEFGEKSEKWQEGERGSATREWIDGWQNLELDEIEIEQPDEIETPDLDHADHIEEMADDPVDGLS